MPNNPATVTYRRTPVVVVCVAEWTLGAVLYEDELAAINECGAVFPVAAEIRSGGVTSAVWAAHWTVSLMALLVLALHDIRLLVSY